MALKGHTSDVSSVAFSGDGKRIVSGSADGTVKFWDADRGTLTLTLRGHKGVVYSVAFSRDGNSLVSTAGPRVFLWEVATGRALARPLDHPDLVAGRAVLDLGSGSGLTAIAAALAGASAVRASETDAFAAAAIALNANANGVQVAVNGDVLDGDGEAADVVLAADIWYEKHLAQRALALGGVRGPPEVLLGEDVGGVQAPTRGNLDVGLLEGDRSVAEVGDPGVALFPIGLVVGMDLGRGEVTADPDPDSLRCDGHEAVLSL